MMAQRSFSDERSVVPAPIVAERRERIYIWDLSYYLHHSIAEILRFGRKHELLHRCVRYPGAGPIYWVTPYAAMRIIAHIRALQGQWFVEGKDFHRHKEMDVRKRRAFVARENAKREAALQAAQTARIAFLPEGKADPEAGEAK